MDGTKVGVFKERDKVRLDGFLKSTDGRRLEAKIRFEVLGDFTNQALEGQLADEKLSRLLVATNLTQSDSSLMKLVTARVLINTTDLPGL